jgi:hypothetical protein
MRGAEFCQNTDPNQRACDGVFEGSRPLQTGSKQPGELCRYRGECAPSSEGPVVCQQAFSDYHRTRACQVQIRGHAGDGPCENTVTVPPSTFPYPDLFARGVLVARYSPRPPPPTPPARIYGCYASDGLRCDGDTERCVKLGEVGEACQQSGTCIAGAFCDPSSQRCRARLPMGDACPPISSAESTCQPAAYCDVNSRTCQSQVGVDQPCTQDAQCRTGVCVNDRCASSDLADLGASLICD